MPPFFYQILLALILIIVCGWLWEVTRAPRWMRLQSELHAAYIERDAIAEKVAECAHRGIPVTLEILTEQMDNEKQIQYLHQQIQECL